MPPTEVRIGARDRHAMPPLFFTALVTFALHGYSYAQVGLLPAEEQIRTIVEAIGVTPDLEIQGARIYSVTALPNFYRRRQYRLAWSTDHGPLPRADSLRRALLGADGHGLRPTDYHLNEIEDGLHRLTSEGGAHTEPDPLLLAELDLLLTDAFLVYGSHLLAGRTNPETIHPEWFANRRGANMAEVLEAAIASKGVSGALRELLPNNTGYGVLQDALSRYRQIAARGGWSAVPEGPPLKKGDRDARVVVLRRRLRESGDLVSTSRDSLLFDELLEDAVRAFQTRHGLASDGTVGISTLAELNATVEDRMGKIVLNLERWRWLPQDLGSHYIIVNIAAFSLDVVRQGESMLPMRVIVGREYRRTPVFSGMMTYLVLSPYWHVPRNIAVRDKLPEIKRDPRYLARQGMKVFEGSGSSAKEVDPLTVDWKTVTAGNFPYRLRQDPGPSNALGKVKFMFPNRFSVYLHDTPARELFQETKRAFSSGCIRLEKPLELADYLLANDPKWNAQTIRSATSKPVEQTVLLRTPMPVHLLYWTAWADDEGVVHFRNDIYGRDTPLAEALASAPPLP